MVQFVPRDVQLLQHGCVLQELTQLLDVHGSDVAVDERQAVQGALVDQLVNDLACHLSAHAAVVQVQLLQEDSLGLGVGKHVNQLDLTQVSHYVVSNDQAFETLLSVAT